MAAGVASVDELDVYLLRMSSDAHAKHHVRSVLSSDQLIELTDLGGACIKAIFFT